MGAKKKPLLILKAGRTSADLGGLAAENDSHLEMYYVRKDRYVDRAMNFDDLASSFVGPKGAGKSAILQMVRLGIPHDGPRIVSLSPTQLAFSALANTNLASPLLTDPHKKQWLYKSLWDYILSTEIGGMEYIEENRILGLLKSVIRTRDEKQVRRLLRMRYDDTGRPESLSTRFLKLIKEVELSGETQVLGAKITAMSKLDPSKVIESNQGQFKLLGLIHEVSRQLADIIESKYFILIDDLDIDWHNESTQNEIVAAMFSSLRKVCRPPNIKAIISIQDRIFRELPVEHKDKFRDAIVQVDWDADSIREMISTRVRYIIDIPTNHIWEKLFPERAFDYIWNRIGGKPREAIRFASVCLETAKRNGHLRVLETDMSQAFKTFSAERVEDIASELEYIYPAFHVFLRQFTGFQKEFPIGKIRDAVDSCLYKSLEGVKQVSWIGGYEQNHLGMAQVLLENGIMLFKRTRKDQPERFDPNIHDINDEHAYVSFHPMYSAGLGLVGDQ